MANEAGKRRYNQRFSRLMLRRIRDFPGHPLQFLVDLQNGTWLATRHGADAPSVQVGHAESLHARGKERLMLEDADFNQMSSWKGERQGAIFRKKGVLIGGVPVEQRTAMMWESLGLLPCGTVASARRTEGWDPEVDLP